MRRGSPGEHDAAGSRRPPSAVAAGVLDLAVLKVQESNGPSYGYALIQELERAGIGGLKGGTVYPLLSRLEEGRLVRSEWRSGDGGPPRKFFSVTVAGRRALEAGTAGWLEFAEGIRALLTCAVSSTRKEWTPC